MKKFTFGILITLSIVSPFVALAQTQTGTGANLGYVPLEPINGVTTDANGGALTFPTLLKNVFNVLITIGALIAVLMLTIGGIQYMVSEAISNKKAGIERAKKALQGILLVAGAWLILNTINPELLNFNLITCQDPSGCSAVSQAPASTGGGGTTNPITSNGNALQLTQQEQQNIQNNINAPDPTTCADARASLQSGFTGFLASIKTTLTGTDAQASQTDQIVRAYVNACAAAGY